jgi:hypothetical protein
MTDDLSEKLFGLSHLTLKTVIVHTITYFVVGLLVYKPGGYEKGFSQL